MSKWTVIETSEIALSGLDLLHGTPKIISLFSHTSFWINFPKKMNKFSGTFNAV